MVQLLTRLRRPIGSQSGLPPFLIGEGVGERESFESQPSVLRFTAFGGLPPQPASPPKGEG